MNVAFNRTSPQVMMFRFSLRALGTALFAGCLCTTGLVAQRSAPIAVRAPSLLISVADLHVLIAQANVVVLQVGSAEEYAAAHIPNARPVSLNDVSTPRAPGSLTLELPDTPALEQWARSVGITNNTRIVVVPSSDALQSSTRVYLTLAYMGFADRTSLLNGGVRAWRESGQAVESGSASPIAASTGPLTVRRDSSVIAVISDVDAATRDQTIAVVDARTPNFYAGDGGGYPRAGHIPTAINVPLTSVSDGGVFKSRDELRALFANAGVKPGDRIITYCHIGQQATLLWFVARELGYDVRMFDGSFQQWSGSEQPVVGPTP